MKQLVENLKVSTWEGTVCAEDALSAFISGGPCAKCCGMAAPHLTALTEYLAAQVAGAISKVLSATCVCTRMSTHYNK